MDIATLKDTHAEHWRMAAAIRALTLDAVAKADSGHTGMPLGMADVATVLWTRHLRFDAAAPDWFDRDRFVLSNGHGSMLLYALLHLTGHADMTLDELKNFRQLGSRTAGHPEYGHAAGIETTTGPLGQGIGNAVGFAIAEEVCRARYGKKICNHRTYVFSGDGCNMEGISHEAISLAGHQKLSHLTLFYDDNGISIDGDTDLADSTDQSMRYRAAGWNVIEIDGHDPDAIDGAIEEAKSSDRPTMVHCKTNIAWGTSVEGTADGHDAVTDPEDIANTKQKYDWSYGPFEVPGEIKEKWEETGRRGAEAHSEWEAAFEKLSQSKQSEITRTLTGAAPKKLAGTIRALKKQLSETQPEEATRASSQGVLEVVNPAMPETVGGSADLTGSNKTKSGDLGVFSPENRTGRYIHYGIREHGMAAAMNGMALHGGVRPYGGTFMVFTDYARPSIRLSALMGAPVVYVMTHDSIGLGEDGPTHQPVEHLAVHRATPNLRLFRPCDAVETAEAWECALTADRTPSVLALSRQSVPFLRREHKTKNLVAQGGYVLAEAEGRRQAILIATGSEVGVAMGARDVLQSVGIGTRVVSLPCMELFAQQDEAYRRRVLPPGPVRVGVEAGMRQGWDRWLMGERGKPAKADFVGMATFGASAPGTSLFPHFGITSEAVADRVRALV